MPAIWQCGWRTVARRLNLARPSRSAPFARDRLPEHGWGLNILKTLADRHDGTLETVQEDGVYRTTVLLKLDAR